MRLTTNSATLYCTTEIPVALASGIFIEEAVSFRLRYAKMLDAFAKRPITAASTPLLGFHPAEQYLSVYLDTGELLLSTVALSPADQPEETTPSHLPNPSDLISWRKAYTPSSLVYVGVVNILVLR